MHVRVNLLHKRFDSLYVVEFDDEASKKYKQSVWKCECDCGRTVSVPAYRLINKEKTDCGQCKDPQPGDVFTGYTVKYLDVEKSKEKHHKYYVCECVCGNIRSVAKSDLLQKKATNCGCLASLNKRDTEDITNKKFKHWTAKRYNKELSEELGTTMWDCECDCGTKKAVSISALKLKKSTSCGCCADETKKEKAAQREQERPNWKVLKKLYYAMVSRCTNPKNSEARNYFERGIRVCDRWSDPEHGFDNFYEDMGSSYKHGLTLDRINVNEGYSPENCRWITMQEQSFNKRNTRYIEIYGMRMALAEACLKFYNPTGASVTRVFTRMLSGFSFEEATQLPIGIKSRESFYRENPDFKIIKKPFMFNYEIAALNLISAQFIDYNQYRMNPTQIDIFLYTRPKAGDYFKTVEKEKEKNGQQ